MRYRLSTLQIYIGEGIDYRIKLNRKFNSKLLMFTGLKGHYLIIESN
jgi:hypothetical protein